MRIITGKARGKSIQTLDGNDVTRPTKERIKESVFSSIQFQIENTVFLDLFGGSGQIGLEAASRGAKKVFICDNSEKAAQIIRKNIITTNLSDIVTFFETDYLNALKKISEIGVILDFIYLDPPYSSEFIREAVKSILSLNLISENSVIICETDRLINFDDFCLEKIKDFKYGKIYVQFFKIRSDK